MIEEKTWEEFRSSGLLYFINAFLHIFGWAIVIETEDIESSCEKINRVYPARVKFRGFSKEITEEAYINLSKYMSDNVEDLLKESMDKG